MTEDPGPARPGQEASEGGNPGGEAISGGSWSPSAGGPAGGGRQGYGPPPGYGAYGGYGKPPAPKPGIIPLRPLSVGEILDGSFTAMRWNPKAILIPSGIVAAVTGVMLAAAMYLVGRDFLGNVSISQPNGPPSHAQASAMGAAAVAAFAVFGAYGIVSFIGNAILTGFLTGVIGQAALGRKETLASAWRSTRSRIGPVIAALLLAGLFVGLGWSVAIGLSVGIGVALGAGAHLAPAGVLLGVACGIAATVFAVMVAIRWSLIIPVVVLERAGPVRSMGRSWRLVRGSWWRVFGILLLTEFIVSVAATLLRAPFEFGGGGFPGTQGSGSVSVAGAILIGVGAIISSAVTAPLLAGAVVLLYTDLRMRREGMDIALQATAAGDGPQPGGPHPGGQYPGGQSPSGQGPATW